MIGETKTLNHEASKTFPIPAMKKNLGTGVNGEPRRLAQGLYLFCSKLYFELILEHAAEEWRRRCEAATTRGQTLA